MTTARVIELPVESVDDSDDVERHDLDDWGRSRRVAAVASALARGRWAVSSGGLDHLDSVDAALLVVSSRWAAGSTLMVASTLTRRLERTVRISGRPQRVPLGPVLARVGAIPARPGEVRQALAGGDLVVVGTHAVRETRRAGRVDPAMIEVALELGVGIFPVAAVSSPASRRARLEVGARVVPSTRRGGLAPIETAESVRDSLQNLLDGLGGAPVLDLIGEV